MPVNEIDWEEVLRYAAESCETNYTINLCIDSRVGWASVFLLAHQFAPIPRGQTMKLFAHPTRLIRHGYMASMTKSYNHTFGV